MPSSPDPVDGFLWTSASSNFEDSEMSIGEIEEYDQSTTKERIKSDPDQSCDSTERSMGECRRSKKKKRKLSVGAGSEAELDREVKTELASDVETSRRKQRRTQKIGVKDEDVAPDVPDDDSYLELRVKQESFAHPSLHDTHKKKKKRKRCISDQSHSDNDQSLFSSTQIEVKQEQDKITSECENTDDTSNKKKKKKHKKVKKMYKDIDVEDEFSATETVIQSPPRNGIHKQCKQDNSVSSTHTSVDRGTPRKSRLSSQYSTAHKESTADQSPVRNSRSTRDQHSDSDSFNNDRYTGGNEVSRSKSLIVNSIPEGSTRKLRMSERIAFEDDLGETVQLEPQSEKQRHDQNVDHMLVKNYIREENLQNIETVIPRSILTQDDDVWIIKCPQEITSSALNAVELPVEGKGKIKVDGNTYDGIAEPNMGHLNVNLCPDSKYVIQSVALKGVLHFRRRIPKPHVRHDATMVNKHQFIPLPQTKTRHPLLGADYKAALALPAPRAATSATTATAVISAATATEQPSAKKKLKRKRNEEAGCRRERLAAEAPPQKRNKSQREPAAAAWDSEQAIEENLFNF